MAEANPLWGAPRIHGELQKLGLEVSQATVSTVPTVLFKVLFVFVVSHTSGDASSTST